MGSSRRVRCFARWGRHDAYIFSAMPACDASRKHGVGGKRHMRVSRRAVALSLGALPMMAGRVAAQRRAETSAEWPKQTVRLVVPFAPGGSTDVAARILAERMGQTLGHSVVVENRRGSGGLVGAE